MSDVKSKNLYELLGNTSDQDSDREPDPPTKAIDKPTTRHGKRDAPKAAPVTPAAVTGSAARGGAGGNRRAGGFTGNEAAFRDRATGRTNNRDKPTGDETETGVRTGRDSGPGTRRAGRGPRGPRRGGDRRDRTGQSEHQKQTDQAWGEPTGEGEWADEKAGEAIANAEVKEGGFDTTTEAPVDGEGNALDAKPEEPEDTHKSYADYLAEKAAKKIEALGLREARQANEGTKENKKWNSAKPLTKDEEEAYFQGQEKARRDRSERTQKAGYVHADDLVDWSHQAPRESRGGRGGRGGVGRGRGGRGDFPSRGRGEARGARGGGRGRGDSAAVVVTNDSDFPSLGGK